MCANADLPPTLGVLAFIKGIIMIKEFLESGKIVGTHGIRGAVRFQPWSDNADFLSGIKTVFLLDGTPIDIISVKPHGNIAILELKDVKSIEDAEKLRNKVLLVKRSDIDIPDDRYFIEEIIGSNVYSEKTGELLGVLSDVSKTGANDVWHIKKEGKEYLIPAIESVVVSVDVENDKVVINPMEGIFDEN